MASAETTPGPLGPLRVLVVDDQPILGELVCEHLREDLHSVESALSGSAALEKFRVTPFDLVITEMTGEQLAEAIKQLNPKTPVILLTGYASGSTLNKRTPRQSTSSSPSRSPPAFREGPDACARLGEHPGDHPKDAVEGQHEGNADKRPSAVVTV